MADWTGYLETQRQRYLDELLGFLRIPSISSLPDRADDVKRAAEWVAHRLRAAGITSARVMATGGHPVVYGEWLGAPGRPTVLVYGHFDVQPVDPVSLWTSPPFEPAIRGGRVYARGASDNKGNMLAPVLAVEALLGTAGSLPLNVKFLFEGQEEIGSPQLPAFISANADLLACDFSLNADSSQWSETEPAMLVGLRGLVALQVDVQGATCDLHSGGFGGAVQNPLHALSSLIAALHRPDGTVAVPGFYDDVVSLSDEERAGIAAVPYSDDAFRTQAGLGHLYGETGYSTYERLWTRPTLEINGMWGGFQGEGIKTVLPCEAHAKLTCRLVPDQDPQHVLDALRAHFESSTPPGVTVAITPEEATAAPYLVPLDHPANRAVAEVLRGIYGREPYLTRSGGSIAVCDIMRRQLGIYSIGFGFGLHDERFHAPDEFFRLSSYDRAQAAWCSLLERLGR